MPTGRLTNLYPGARRTRTWKAGTPAPVSGYKECCPEPTMDWRRYSGLSPPSAPGLVALYPRPYLASWWARSALRSGECDPLCSRLSAGLQQQLQPQGMKGAGLRPWPAPGPPIPGCPRKEGLVRGGAAAWSACLKGAIGALGALGDYRWESRVCKGSLEL